jgi:hypothetical protein
VTREEALAALTAAGCEVTTSPRDYKALRERIILDTKFYQGATPRAFSCLRKRKLGQEAAEKEARRLDKPTIHAYACDFCAGWHVGKRDKVRGA